MEASKNMGVAKLISEYLNILLSSFAPPSFAGAGRSTLIVVLLGTEVAPSNVLG